MIPNRPAGTSKKARFLQSAWDELRAARASIAPGFLKRITTRGTHLTPFIQRSRSSFQKVPFFEVTFPASRQGPNNTTLPPAEVATVENGFLHGLYPGELRVGPGENIPADAPLSYRYQYADTSAQSYRMESKRFRVSWQNAGATFASPSDTFRNSASMGFRVWHGFRRKTIYWEIINGIYTAHNVIVGIYVDSSVEGVAFTQSGTQTEWQRRDTRTKALVSNFIGGGTGIGSVRVRSPRVPIAFERPTHFSEPPTLTITPDSSDAEDGSQIVELTDDEYRVARANGAIYFSPSNTTAGNWIRNRYAPYTFRAEAIE